MVAIKATTLRCTLMFPGYTFSTRAATHTASGGFSGRDTPFMVGDIQLSLATISLAVTIVFASAESVGSMLLLTKNAARHKTMSSKVSLPIFLTISIINVFAKLVQIARNAKKKPQKLSVSL